MTKTLLISDLHCGGGEAPAPEKCAGMVKGRTALQKYLYSNYLKLACNEAWDYVILNGDVIEGTMPVIQRNNSVITCRGQIDMAKKLLSKLKYDKMLITEGTPFHSNTEDNEIAEEILAKEIGAKFAREFFIDIDGYKTHICHAIHHEGEAAGKLSKEIQTYGCDLLIRSHRHEYAFVETIRGCGVITPSWQWRNSFGIANGLNDTLVSPDIGCAVLDTESNRNYIKVTPRFVDMTPMIGICPKIHSL